MNRNSRLGCLTPLFRIGLACLVIVTSTACSEAAPPSVGYELTDSGGIALATSYLPTDRHWTVHPNPSVEIGSAEGGAGHDLSLPWASQRLSDGRIAVANARSNELRIFSAEGEFLGAFGRDGEGPGEFTRIASFSRQRGDTLVVSDARLLRLTILDEAGDLVRTAPLESVSGRQPRFRQLVDDSTALFRVQYAERGGGVHRVARDTFQIFAQTLSGASTVEIGRFPAREQFYQIAPNGGIMTWDLPFGRDMFAAVADGLIWIAMSDRYELKAFDPLTGRLVRLLRVNHSVADVQAEHHDRYWEHELSEATNPGFRALLEGVKPIIEYSPIFPAFSEMINDTENNLWVRDYTPPWHEGPATWRVYSAMGEPLAQAELPSDLDVHQIGSDYVMGLWRDELDVEYIRVYTLDRR